MRTIAQVRAAVRAIAPELTQAHIRPAGQDQCCEAWWVGDEHVFRFALNTEVDAELEREMALLPALAEAIDLTIPLPAFIGRDPTSSRIVVGHRAVIGEALTRHNFGRLPERARDRITEGLGTFLAQLQAFPLSSVHIELPESRYHQILRNTERIERLVFPRMPAADIEACLAMLHAFRISPKVDWVLTHSDLYEDHILFDPKSGQLTGIIDFGDLSIGDPCCDLNTLIDDFGLDFAAAVGGHLSPGSAAEHLARARVVCIWESLAWSAKQLTLPSQPHDEIDANLARLRAIIEAHRPWW